MDITINYKAPNGYLFYEVDQPEGFVPRVGDTLIAPGLGEHQVVKVALFYNPVGRLSDVDVTVV